MIPIGKIVSSISNLADDLIETKEEKKKSEIEFHKIDSMVMDSQVGLNMIEAKSKSFFVCGWRPALGWICAIGLLYDFLIYPILMWFWFLGVSKGYVEAGINPPKIDTVVIIEMIGCMLGLGSLRTYEKMKGVNTNSIKKKKP